jgi:hypothetical protein
LAIFGLTTFFDTVFDQVGNSLSWVVGRCTCFALLRISDVRKVLGAATAGFLRFQFFVPVFACISFGRRALFLRRLVGDRGRSDDVL